MTRKRSLSDMEAMIRKTDFFLPEGISCDKVLRQEGTWSYIFKSESLGDIGHLVFLSYPGGTKCVYEAAGEPDDPMTAERRKVFTPIAEYISSKMELICGKSDGEIEPYNLQQEVQIVESKLMPCAKCGTITSLMVFAPEASTLGQLENYARRMFAKIKEQNVPTWIVGEETEILIDGQLAGEALVLKVWPKREPARIINSIGLNAMFDDFMDNHCKGR